MCVKCNSFNSSHLDKLSTFTLLTSFHPLAICFDILSNNHCMSISAYLVYKQCMFVLNLFDKVLGIFIIGTHNWFSFVPLFIMAERGTKHDQPWVMKYTCTCFLWNHLNAWGSMFEDTILLVCEGLIFLCTGSYFGFLNI